MNYMHLCQTIAYDLLLLQCLLYGVYIVKYVTDGCKIAFLSP